MNYSYDEIENEEFDRILGDILDEEGRSLLLVPGVYEVVREYFNNDVLDRWNKEREDRMPIDFDNGHGLLQFEAFGNMEKNKRIQTKGDIAKVCIPKDITFDYALPQNWLDAFSSRPDVKERFTYNQILSTTFYLYPPGINFGFAWSAIKEIDDLIHKKV